MRLVGIAALAALALTLAAACSRNKEKDVRETAPTTTPVAPAPEPKKPVTFAKKPPVVGERLDGKMSVRMKLALSLGVADAGDTAKAQPGEMETFEAERRIEETLAVSGDARTRVKVTYVDKTSGQKAAGKEDKRASPLNGKTYVIEAKDGKVVVESDKGKPAPSSEATEVAKHYKALGQPDPILAAMPGTPLTPGEAVPALAKALGDEMARGADGMAVRQGSVVFRELAGEVGVFEVSFLLAKDEGPIAFAVDLKGLLKVKRDTSMPLSMELGGPVTLTPKADSKPKLSGEGKGTMEMSMSATRIGE